MSFMRDGAGPNASDQGAFPAPIYVHIDQVSCETAISRETLLGWERRYGFPQPSRDESGDRLYSQYDIDKLKVLKRLVHNGLRPGALVHRTLDELRGLLRDAMPRTGMPPNLAQLQPLLDLVKRHDVRALRRALNARLRDSGLERFVFETVAPLCTTVGAMWSVGELEIFEEHLITELIQALFNEALHDDSRPYGSPTIALATLPSEKHQLGLRMAQALFAVNNARCIYLGAQVPVDELIHVVDMQDIDVVALSIAPSFPMKVAEQAIALLDASLPDSVEVWLGGSATSTLRNVPRRIRVLTSLAAIRPTLQSWRAAHSLPPIQSHCH